MAWLFFVTCGSIPSLCQELCCRSRSGRFHVLIWDRMDKSNNFGNNLKNNSETFVPFWVMVQDDLEIAQFKCAQLRRCTLRWNTGVSAKKSSLMLKSKVLLKLICNGGLALDKFHFALLLNEKVKFITFLHLISAISLLSLFLFWR